MRNAERNCKNSTVAPRRRRAPATRSVALWLAVAVGLGACSSTDAPPEATQGGPLSQADVGRQVYARLRCGACHTLDGRVLSAPTLKGLYGKPVMLANGTSVIADDEYIRRSILEPRKELVRGYAPSMTSYQGQLKRSELDALVAMIRSLGEQPDSAGSAQGTD